MSPALKMADENIANMFEQLNVVDKGNKIGVPGSKQRLQSLVGEQHQRDPLKVTLSNLQIHPNGSNNNRAPSMLIRKASIDHLNRIPSVVRKPSIDRLNSNGSSSTSASTITRKPSIDLHSRKPSLIRKGSLDGLSVNLNTKRAISASSSSSKALNAPPPSRGVDIGTYDDSMERDKRRGRWSNNVKGGLLDLDAQQ
jgi:hypothetical protein